MATDLPGILIVDDNEDNRYTLQLLLETDGHERIVCAASGKEAIALIEKGLHRPACKREENPCQLGAVHTWHIATVRCEAPIRSLSEAYRTFRKRREHTDVTRLTPLRHWPD
jgi:CheY-like chemotaxis protein